MFSESKYVGSSFCFLKTAIYKSPEKISTPILAALSRPETRGNTVQEKKKAWLLFLFSMIQATALQYCQLLIQNKTK